MKFNIKNIEDISNCINELKDINFNVDDQVNDNSIDTRVKHRRNIQELEVNLESIKHSMSTLNIIDRLRYAAIPATAVAAILGPVAFASVAGLSAVTLGIGSWKANKERNNLLSQIDRLKKSDANDNVRVSDDFVSKVNSIAVGGSSL